MKGHWGVGNLELLLLDIQPFLAAIYFLCSTSLLLTFTRWSEKWQHAWSACDTVVSYHSEEPKLGIYYYLKGIFNAYLNHFWRVLPCFIAPVGGWERKLHSFQENTDLSHAGVYNPQVNVCLETLQRYRPISRGLRHWLCLKSNTSSQPVTPSGTSMLYHSCLHSGARSKTKVLVLLRRSLCQAHVYVLRLNLILQKAPGWHPKNKALHLSTEHTERAALT